MTKHPPAPPPEQQSAKGPRDTRVAERDSSRPSAHEGATATRGDSANIKQNTTNQGLQQDR